ncbi:MAG: hypothetical protein RLZZ282_429 [Verrucomicrobiota bacterium]|jgi:pimeloyl-ACP methyl ester carboxylesterase
MKPVLSTLSLALVFAFAFTACVPSPSQVEQAKHKAAADFLKQASEPASPPDQRAALYLSAAAAAWTDSSDLSARVIYNKAAADLTVLLRNAHQGQRWNRPLTLTTGTTTYRLHFAKATRNGVWDPNYFTSFTPAAEVRMKSIQRQNRQDGLGGALVGRHQPAQREVFTAPFGVTAPVTSILDFKGRDVTLTLIDPTKTPKSQVKGSERLLEADFSAPLASYPQKSEYWNGIMGALHVEAYMGKTGLFMLQPYDADRIPLIFVHGLISTPQMWRNVINEIEADPVLRNRYQCWVFSYPTGNPPAYSAMRFRQELDQFYKIYPHAKPYVLVGHSMGGLISRMEATTVTREAWDSIGKKKAQLFFAAIKKNSLVEQAIIFNANPHIGRLVFICTPHRGSQMALSKLGEFAQRLIFLPVEITASVAGSLVDSNAFAIFMGDSNRLPTSVTGLSPTNPMLKVLDAQTIQAPHHTIAGDQGKGNTPNSSDGVVPYWSSHLKSANSECIVPGPHGACELPQTLTELRRILHLHLNSTSCARLSHGPRIKTRLHPKSP